MRYLTLDVFTDRMFGGNQLAVFPDAREIPEELLLPITREFNFSEVTFCYPSDDAVHTRRVRIFTPGEEMPFAGHPTIGTSAALALCEGALGGAREGRLTLKLGVGTVPVEVRMESESLAWAELSVAKLPEVGPPVPTVTTLAEILSLEPSDFVGGTYSPQAVSCGIPFLLAPLKSVAAVSRARIRLDRWEQTLKKSWAPEIFVAARDPEQGEQHWRARMFAPGLNVPEDPATGSAVAAFGGWLAMKDAKRDAEFGWTVRQGIEMERPSLLQVRAEKKDGAVTAVRVSGHAVLTGEGALRLPPR
ncbi:MAG: PhzF family phenazine biosynthesis protein [Gemmatimonadaceae bacterium]|nr:PhzF family phenazine biosynthesis protein [Gemmatimonadaceae bacterium]